MKVVEILVGAGVSPDTLADESGGEQPRPLVIAAHYGRTPLVAAKLELGDPNSRSAPRR